MNEEELSELIEKIEQSSENFWLVQSKLPQCHQAVEWAKQTERWDLVIKAAQACKYEHLTRSIWAAKLQNKKISDEEKLNFCRQMQNLALVGLMAARHIKDKQAEQVFLSTLSQLSVELGNFDKTLDYLKQRLSFVPIERRWDIIGREAFHFGNAASKKGDYSTARALFQLSLDLMESSNKYGTANILDFMAANELNAGNLERAHELMEQVEQLRKQLGKQI